LAVHAVAALGDEVVVAGLDRPVEVSLRAVVTDRIVGQLPGVR
jgi:hypothetical protein